MMRFGRVCIAAIVVSLGTSLAQAQDSSPQAYYNAGAQFLQQGDTAKAIQYISYALQQDPSIQGGWTRLGYAYETSGQKEKAVEAYSKAVAQDPNDTYASQRFSALGGAPAPSVPAPASSEADEDMDEAVPRAQATPVGRAPEKKIFVGVGMGYDLNMSAGFGELYGGGIGGGAYVDYALKPNFRLQAKLHYASHAADDAAWGTIFDPFGFFSNMSVEVGNISTFEFLVGAKRIFSKSGASTRPYVVGNLGMSSVSQGETTISYDDPFFGPFSFTVPGGSESGLGLYAGAGLEFGNKLGGFVELGLDMSSVVFTGLSGVGESLSFLRVGGGLSF